jgi:hypothetical protein
MLTLPYFNQNIMNRIIYCLIIVLFACQVDNTRNTKFDYNKKIVDISNYIVNHKTPFVIGSADIQITKDYLIVFDYQSFGSGMHLFDKNNLQYLSSTGVTGKGPNEIVNYSASSIVSNYKKNKFIVFDYSKLKMFEFDIEKAICNNKYMPKCITKLNSRNFPGNVKFYKDSILIGKIDKVINHHTLRESLGMYNYYTHKVNIFEYEHPEIESHSDTKSIFNISIRNKLLASAYMNKDLLSIYNLDGSVKLNIYGSEWGKKCHHEYYGAGIDFYKEFIICTYLSDKPFSYDENKRPKSIYPTKLVVFDIDGNFISTLETKHEIAHIASDEENDRLYIYFVDLETPVSYIDLKEVMKKCV